METKRIESHLYDWAIWHQADRGDARGYPGRAMGITYKPTTDFDEMVREVDVRVARIVETCVDELALWEKQALFHKYLGAKWAGTPAIYVQCVESATFLLGKKLEKRGVA